MPGSAFSNFKSFCFRALISMATGFPMRTTWEQRTTDSPFFLFPNPKDVQESRRNSTHFISTPISQIYNMMQYYFSQNNLSAYEGILVTRIQHGKYKDNALHEFLIVHYEDSRFNPPDRNYAIVERTVAGKDAKQEDMLGPKSVTKIRHASIDGSQSSSSANLTETIHASSGSCHAQDSILISSHGSPTGLDNGIGEHDILYTIKLPERFLTMAKLLILAKTVSGAAPIYRLLGEMCYWYCGAIVEVIRRIHQKQYGRDLALIEHRGLTKQYTSQFGIKVGFPEKADQECRPEALCDAFEANWASFDQEIREEVLGNEAKSNAKAQDAVQDVIREADERVAEERKAREAADSRALEERKAREAADSRALEERKAREASDEKARQLEERLAQFLSQQESSSGSASSPL